MASTTEPPGHRIAMWSGPRNISTALLRSWGSRADTYVCDEPFYAHYLRETGIDHPGRDEIVAHHDPDWRRVAAWLTGPVPEGKRLFYQKHMAHHLLPGMEGDWLWRLRHAFLLRDPREMLSSLAKVLPAPRLEDTGLPQQWALFEQVWARTGAVPPVVEARDVLEDPRAALTALCRALGVPFDEAMLAWAPGPRPTDGIWAKYWYESVERSTGFQPYTPKADPVPPHVQDVCDRALAYYHRLSEHRLSAVGS